MHPLGFPGLNIFTFYPLTLYPFALYPYSVPLYTVLLYTLHFLEAYSRPMSDQYSCPNTTLFLFCRSVWNHSTSVSLCQPFMVMIVLFFCILIIWQDSIVITKFHKLTRTSYHYPNPNGIQSNLDVFEHSEWLCHMIDQVMKIAQGKKLTLWLIYTYVCKFSHQYWNSPKV